ncbi:U3 small nucleolar RNA-associated protein 4 homolog isoform X2 [Liolophura sinensis]|uniref:U3 small nucleolar RNA-associated protein 4 homolog isoform X2 n=1 Tax=Liolophura sinensis TaxID=3198878 RepID=UPI003158E152
MANFRVHRVRFFEYQPKAIHCIAYQKDTNRVAVSRSDGTLEIWSIEDKWFQEKVIVGHEEQSVEAVVWSGQRLFTAGLSGDVVEYDLCKLQSKTFVSSNAGAVWCLTRNSSNTKLAAGTEYGCIVLFDLTGELLTYEKAFDRQEGRILSLSWHVNEEVIVTGGIDNIRVWSVNSGHAIQRLTLPRQENHKETIVWSVVITGDMTIISGDSRGKTSFWNGKQGTVIRSFQSHKADVLCLAVNESENSVLSSGVEPTLARFEYVSTNPNSDWKTWIRSTVHCQHTHDVRSLAYAGHFIISGGVDTNLAFTDLEKRKPGCKSRKIPAIPQKSLVAVATNANLVVLNYSTHLEVWRLGCTRASSDRHGEVLPLREGPTKLLQLMTKNSNRIVCFAISSDGKWLAYSDQERMRLYCLSLEADGSVTPKISLTRIKLSSAVACPAHKIMFTPDVRYCVIAACDGTVNVYELHSDCVSMYHSFPSPSEPASPVQLLSISPHSKLLAVYHHNHPIQIYDIKSKEVLEYCVAEEEYTAWCREHLRKAHPQWMRRTSKIYWIDFNPQAPHQILLHDEQMLCVLDKSQPFPDSSINIYSKSASEKHSGCGTSSEHAFHICMKYKFLLHVEALKDDWLVVVERPPITIFDALPPTLKQKKFGT